MKVFKKIWPFLFFASILAILFYKVFFLGQVFFEGDNFHLNIPVKYFLVDQILQGKFPLWNPYLFLGIPYFADLNVGLLHPLNFIYFLFPVPRALTFVVIIDFFLISTFQYMFLRSFKLSKFASSLGAIIFAFGGVPFNTYGNIAYFNIVVFIPLIFFLVFKFYKEKQIKWLFILIFVQFLQFISGHPQITYYTMFFVSFFLFLFTNFTFKKKVKYFFLYLIGPLILSSVILIPFIEFVLNANRPVGNIDYSSWGNLTIVNFLTFFFPTIFGNHVDGNWWGPQSILTGYVTVSGFILAIVGLLKTKFVFKKFFISGVILSILLAMGKLTPVFYIFYYLVPGWKFFRAPSGLIIFYTFFISILAGYGMEYVILKKFVLPNLVKFIIWLSLIVGIFSVSVLIFSYQNLIFWKKFIQILVTKGHIHFVSHLLLYDGNKVQQIFITTWWNIILFTISIFFTLFFLFYIKNKKILSVSILALTIISLVIVDSKTVAATSINLYNNNLPIPKFLAPVIEGKYRALSLQIDLHQKRENLPGKYFFLDEANGNINMYKDDNNIERGIYQARGYSSLIPASYANFLNSHSNIDVTGVDVTHLSRDQLNIIGIKYILSHEKLTNNSYNNISLKSVSSLPEKYFVYENTTSFKRAYLLEDPYGKEVTFEKITPTYLSFAVNTTKPAPHFILSDWYYPGWKAFVNGKDTHISPYIGTFREISISKGRSKVEFLYDPISLKIGLIISTIAMIIWITLFTFSLKKRKIFL